MHFLTAGKMQQGCEVACCFHMLPCKQKHDLHGLWAPRTKFYARPPNTYHDESYKRGLKVRITQLLNVLKASWAR